MLSENVVVIGGPTVSCSVHVSQQSASSRHAVMSLTVRGGANPVYAYIPRSVDYNMAHTKCHFFEHKWSWFVILKVNKPYLFSLTNHKFI